MSGTMIQSISMDKMRNDWDHTYVYRAHSTELPRQYCCSNSYAMFVGDCRFPIPKCQNAVCVQSHIIIIKWHIFISHFISFLNFSEQRMSAMIFTFFIFLMPSQTACLSNIFAGGIGRMGFDFCQQKKW